MHTHMYSCTHIRTCIHRLTLHTSHKDTYEYKIKNTPIQCMRTHNKYKTTHTHTHRPCAGRLTNEHKHTHTLPHPDNKNTERRWRSKVFLTLLAGDQQTQHRNDHLTSSSVSLQGSHQHTHFPRCSSFVL